MELKSQFYECITCFYMGKQSEEHQKWGECLAYYTEAFNKLNECIKKSKVSVGVKHWPLDAGDICVLCKYALSPHFGLQSEDGDIQESFRFAMDVIGGK